MGIIFFLRWGGCVCCVLCCVTYVCLSVYINLDFLAYNYICTPQFQTKTEGAFVGKGAKGKGKGGRFMDNDDVDLDVRVCVCVWVCGVHIYVHVCVYMCSFFGRGGLCVYIYMYLKVCCVCPLDNDDVDLDVCVCVCVCMYICIHICVCVCLCVFVRTYNILYNYYSMCVFSFFWRGVVCVLSELGSIAPVASCLPWFPPILKKITPHHTTPHPHKPPTVNPTQELSKKKNNRKKGRKNWAQQQEEEEKRLAAVVRALVMVLCVCVVINSVVCAIQSIWASSAPTPGPTLTLGG